MGLIVPLALACIVLMLASGADYLIVALVLPLVPIPFLTRLLHDCVIVHNVGFFFFVICIVVALD